MFRSGTPLEHELEAILFSAGRTLNVAALIALYPELEKPTEEAVIEALQALKASYSDRGIELLEVSSGWRFQTKSEHGVLISKLFEEKPPKYSRAFLETLALIAYRQPITRGEIEDIRGVAVSPGILKTLMDHEWVRVIGHREVPGRPELLATTRVFLDHFGLKSLEELPPLAPERDIATIAKELEALEGYA